MVIWQTKTFDATENGDSNNKMTIEIPVLQEQQGVEEAKTRKSTKKQKQTHHSFQATTDERGKSTCHLRTAKPDHTAAFTDTFTTAGGAEWCGQRGERCRGVGGKQQWQPFSKQEWNDSRRRRRSCLGIVDGGGDGDLWRFGEQSKKARRRLLSWLVGWLVGLRKLWLVIFMVAGW
jgi:hypothetical protein